MSSIEVDVERDDNAKTMGLFEWERHERHGGRGVKEVGERAVNRGRRRNR